MTESATNLLDRDIRQRDLVPPNQLASCHAIVIGVGAIGRQVALQLAILGIPRMRLVDHDTVGVENLAAQGYWPDDLGQPKVETTGRICRSIQPSIELETRQERFRRSSARELPSIDGHLVLFCCVDSMEARRLVWESTSHQLSLFVDGRMNAEVLRVLVAENPATDGHYQTTLFSDTAAYGGSCTGRSTIYTASIAAGLMIGQFTKWLRKLPCDADLMFNMLSSELTVASVPTSS